MICGYLYHSSLINPLFSKLVSFSINKYNRHFFFSKIFNSKTNLFQQKTTNQSINQLIPFSNISLSKKKEQMQQQHFTQNSHTLLTQTLICYDLLIINTSTQEGVMFLNNTLQLCFTTNPLISQPHFPPKRKPTTSRT